MTERPGITYKVVEVAPVTEESLQAALNERTAEGWSFESLHFVMRDGSHRPPMAYLFFTRGRTASEGPGVGWPGASGGGGGLRPPTGGGAAGATRSPGGAAGPPGKKSAGPPGRTR